MPRPLLLLLRMQVGNTALNKHLTGSVSAHLSCPSYAPTD